MNDLKTELKTELSSIRDLITSVNDKLDKNSVAADERINNLETKISVDIQELKASLSAEINSLKTSNQTLTSEVAELRRTQEINIKSLQDRTLSLETSLDKNNTAIDSLKTTVSVETVELHNAKIKIANLETELEGVKHELEGIDDISPANCYTKEESDVYSGQMEATIVALQHKLASMEYACNRSQQNSRKFNVEFDGIPMEVGEEPEKLEEAVLKLLAKMEVPCEAKDIDAIHRLPSKTGKKGTIVRLHRRKLRDDILKNKMKLKNLKDWGLDIDGLNDDSAIYVKANLCPYYKTLAFNCRLLKKHELISGTSVDDDGTVKIKTFDNYSEKILHENKLRRMFPQFRLFKFSANEH